MMGETVGFLTRGLFFGWNGQLNSWQDKKNAFDFEAQSVYVPKLMLHVSHVWCWFFG
ncbi:hypothetical Protein YC6258_03506 [Gynuella sunshinyii YC6258]|uniref:Uncharacterized protein n=1 Tax=Gynuella sunshinyii YC6258 TaxID=1445510 RepID=A0A0C5VLF5_9GAMM|nr:hypothetical Protein YC6258_03506 [Gynuella sunshinyii YC6258]